MQPLIEAVKPHHIPQIIRIKAGLKLLNVTQLTHNLKTVNLPQRQIG